MEITAPRICSKTYADWLPSSLRLYALLLSTLFCIEMLVMQILPYIIPSMPSTSILADFTDAFLLTTLSAPFLWSLIVRPLNKIALTQKSRAETVLQNVAEGVICFGEQGRIESVNPAAEAIFGYSAAELKIRDIMFLFSNADTGEKSLSVSDLTQSKAGKNSHLFQNLIGLRKDGSPYQLDFSVSKVNMVDQAMFIGIMHDAEGRKKAEKELGLAAKVFENMGEAISITDADNNFTSVNPVFSRITGYTPEEIIGKNPRVMASGRHDAAFFQEMWGAIKETGYWHGEIWDRRKNGEVYPKWLSIGTVKDNQGNILNYIGIFSDISERKAADERIQFMAHYDALTQLPNRVLLYDRLAHAIASASRFNRNVAILFLDLDRFKTINDTLGHSVGDLLLQSVAERLKGCSRSSDTVARLGGDEFVVFLTDLPDAAHAATVAQKILDTISVPFMIGEIELNTTVSIGISIYPDDGNDIETLISNADVAMYRSKGSGRNNYQFFTPDMNASSYERLVMENSLRRALERQEFVLYYQPQVDSKTGRIIGAEALIRWQHPEMGLVPPGKFIPMAEDCGLIVAIGEWGLREACRQNRVWQQEGLTPIPVAVNLSAVQFHQKNLMELIAEALVESGLESRWLELEITESCLMQDAEAAVNTFHSLKRMGLKLSIDDFGTGYSSLSYLKRFPLDKLKIDQSFIRDITSDPNDAVIVTAIIGLAKSLNLRVIAEGVENKGQLDYLHSHDCTEIQGYYFSRPVPADEFRQLLLKGLWNESLCRDCDYWQKSGPMPEITNGERPCEPCIYV